MPKHYKFKSPTDAELPTIFKYVIREKITHLDLSDGAITAVGARTIQLFLKQFPDFHLVELNLNNNPLGDRGALEISHGIATHKKLQHLYLNQCGINESGADNLGKALFYNTSLVILELADNDLLAEGAELLTRYLPRNTTLRTLNIAGNEISDDGLARMEHALQTNTTLTRLVLSDNEITDAGTTFFRRMNIRELDLSHNYIGVGAIRLLRNAHRIQYFVLHHNMLSSCAGSDGEALLALCKMLIIKRDLVVDLRENNFSEADLEQLTKLRLPNVRLDPVKQHITSLEEKEYVDVVLSEAKMPVAQAPQLEEKFFSPRHDRSSQFFPWAPTTRQQAFIETMLDDFEEEHQEELSPSKHL